MSRSLQAATQAHYDEYPFIEGGTNRIAWWKNYLLGFLPDEEIRGSLMLDVGSSVGEISRGLIERGARMACLDLSLQSLRRCRERNPEAEIIHGSALELPFPDATFDHSISIGVLHHTPDCRRGFHELARVTAPGGTIVVFLYNYWNIYNPIYHLFKPVRDRIPLEKIPSWMVRVMQPFARLHLGQKLSDRELRNLLGDKLWTPQATFHSVAEVRHWGVEEGLTLTGVKKFFLGYANVMRFLKNGHRDRTLQRTLRMKCVECGEEANVTRRTEGFVCGRCGHLFPADGGIIECLKN